jgi:septum formation protein
MKNPALSAFPFSLVLGSASPRRQELLQQLGFDFQVLVRPIDEENLPAMPVNEVAEWLCRSKAQAFQDLLDADPMLLLIAADTVVWKDNTLFGKPANRQQAIDMLMALQGQTHQVSTAVCLGHKSGLHSFTDTAMVRVRSLNLPEIEYYVDAAQPFDKAGAYGIQEWFGMACIERIEGDFYTIMGLPTNKLYRALLEFNPAV